MLYLLVCVYQTNPLKIVDVGVSCHDLDFGLEFYTATRKYNDLQESQNFAPLVKRRRVDFSLERKCKELTEELELETKSKEYYKKQYQALLEKNRRLQENQHYMSAQICQVSLYEILFVFSC